MAERLNKPLMPWQRLVADVLMEVDPESGGLVYGSAIITVPRQSGKSTFVLAKATHRCTATPFFGPRQRVVYTAQTRQKAREKWEDDYAAELEQSATFRTRARPFKAAGNEHLKFQNGSRFGIESNTEKAGHGSTLDEAYIDEAFAQADGRLEQAFRPAMITRPNTQLLLVSTAGWSDVSLWFRGKVDAGREASLREDSTIAYFEWSAEDDADPDDPETWWSCMPALGHTITEEAIRAEREAMSDADFRRAYLNQWVPKPLEIDPELPIPIGHWMRAADESGALLPLTGKVLAVDMPPERGSASIAACGIRPDGLPQIEVVASEPGTDWVAAKAIAVAQRNQIPTVVIDSMSPAKALKPALEAAGVTVLLTKAADMVIACGSLFDAVTADPPAVRQVPHPAMTAAITGARKRSVGDAWAFDRKRADVDISPIVAGALAYGQVVAGASPDYDIASSIF